MVRCSPFRSARSGSQVLPFSISVYMAATQIDGSCSSWPAPNADSARDICSFNARRDRRSVATLIRCRGALRIPGSSGQRTELSLCFHACLNGGNNTRSHGDERGDEADVRAVLPRRAARFGQEGNERENKVESRGHKEQLRM